MTRADPQGHGLGIRVDLQNAGHLSVLERLFIKTGDFGRSVLSGRDLIGGAVAKLAGLAHHFRKIVTFQAIETVLDLSGFLFFLFLFGFSRFLCFLFFLTAGIFILNDIRKFVPV